MAKKQKPSSIVTTKPEQPLCEPRFVSPEEQEELLNEGLKRRAEFLDRCEPKFVTQPGEYE